MPSGGFRIPSEDKIAEAALSMSKTTMQSMELIKKCRPARIRVYKKDLDRFRKIGGGDCDFVCKLAHDCWLQAGDLKRLKALGDGNARIGLINALNIAEAALKKEDEDNGY